MFYFLFREVDKNDEEVATNVPQAPIPLPPSSDAVSQAASSSATAPPSSANVSDVDPSTSTAQAAATSELAKTHVLLTARRPSTKPKPKPEYKTYSDRYSDINNIFSS